MKWLARRMPELPHKLRSARIADTPEYYIKKTVMTSLMLSVALTLISFSFTKSPKSLFVLLLTPMLFMYFLQFAEMKAIQLGKNVNQELVYAGRFLVIELESGVPLYDTFQNLARNYEHIGRYFQEIVDMVNLGTSIEDAINEQIEYIPSDGLRRVFWQILNSLRTGSEVSKSLQVAIDHIVRQQKIEVVEYGRKLNPLAMFYMMMAVILPSLGIIMVIVMATFIGFQLSLPILLSGAGLLMFMQFMFYAMIKQQRPSVGL